MDLKEPILPNSSGDTKPIIAPTVEVKRPSIDVGYLGLQLQSSDSKPSENLSKLSDRLSIRCSDVADMYLLSFVDESHHIDDPKTKGMNGKEEIQYYFTKTPPDYERAKLLYETYDLAKEIATKHVLSATRAMLYEYKVYVPKEAVEDELTRHFSKILQEADSGNNPRDILSNLNVDDVLGKLEKAFEGHDVNWVKVCQSTRNLHNTLKSTSETLSFRELTTAMTLLHQRIHAGGGGVLELMLYPSEKYLGNGLLLRFRSESPKLTELSMFRYGSQEAKKLFQTDRRQRHPFAQQIPEPVDEEEEQILLAGSLLNNSVFLARADRVATSLSEYPLFKTILNNVFGGQLNPEDSLLLLAKDYLTAAVEKKTINPSTIVHTLIEKQLYKDVFRLAGSSSFSTGLSPEVKAEITSTAMTSLTNTSLEVREDVLLFIERSDILFDEQIPKANRSDLVEAVKKLLSTSPIKSYEYIVAKRIVERFK